MQKTDLVLSLDPGKSDFAWAIVRGDGTVLETGMIKAPINEFNYIHRTRQIKAFTAEVVELLQRHTYFALVAERYQIRGMGMIGEVCEFVNLMLGIVIAHARLLPDVPHIDLIPASQWKGWLSTVMYGKSGELDKSPDAYGYTQVTKQASKNTTRNVMHVKEHQFDAISIGLWFVAHEVEDSTTPDQLLVTEIAKACIDAIWAENANRG